MYNSTSSLETAPRVSPKLVIATLAISGWVLAFLSEFLPDSVNVAGLAMLVLALSIIAWALESRNTRVGRWFTIIVLAVVVLLVNAWLRLPGSLAWMAIPTCLAAALIGLRAATGAALGETALLLLLPLFTRRIDAAGADGAAIGVALGTIWGTLGVMVAVYHPVYQAIGQTEAHFKHAQSLIEEARDRKAELEQALADLANANRQLVLASERMAALRTIAEEAQKAKTMFVAKVSHEFRTPLNMIIGLVGLMVETPEIYDVILPSEMSSDLKVVHRNCQHLANLVNDVLNLTQMEAGRLIPHKERVDLHHLVDSAVTAVRPLVEKKGLFLRVEGPDDLPPVYCDAIRIQQVILNLVSNAARFTAKGGITVRVEQEDQHVVVSVTDTGTGISAEDAERIFEPFCQGVGDMWRDKGGSGLGLTISKQFVQLHGGQMWLESELGVGSSFLFNLPISPSAGHVARPGHQIREDWVWRERAFRTDRVGLADQSARPRLVILDETNTLCTQFAGYSDLIEHIETHDLAQIAVALEQCPAHAVVLNAAVAADLWPLVESARAAISDTPIVGCSVPRPLARAVEAGAMGYLTKPVTQADLEEAIENVGKPLRRVLVVDDNPDVLRLLTRMLHVCDDTLSVATASSGEQALEELHSKPFDLVLLDVVMPGMDGWEVLERLRQGDRTAKLPVLFVSAQDLVDQPPESKLLVTTMGEGLSISQLLRCSLALPELLLKPEGEPGPEPLQTAEVRPAWVGRGQRPELGPDPLP